MTDDTPIWRTVTVGPFIIVADEQCPKALPAARRWAQDARNVDYPWCSGHGFLAVREDIVRRMAHEDARSTEQVGL